MHNGRGPKYLFHDFCLDPEARICTAGGLEVHLAQRPFEVLTFLITNRDRVVSRAELLDKFWDGHDVYDDALRKCVGTIRRALNDLEKPGRFIETRYGGGYRFVADVEVVTRNGNGASNGYAAKADQENAAGLPDTDGVPARPMVLRYRVATAISLVLLAFSALGIYVYIQGTRSDSSATTGEIGTVQVRSIAVMPIRNLTGDAGNDYFSDGLTESLIAELSRIDELRVISRSSTFTFKDKEADPRDIGKRLGVDALLEGGVQKSGETVTINVRLVSTRDGSVIWTGNNFKRPITSAFDLEEVISCSVAAELRSELCGKRVNRKTTDGLAYQEYLKGRYEWNKRTPDGIGKSVEHYKRAVALDPNYSLAYAGLADSYIQGIWHVPFAEKEVLPKARAAIEKAIELDDTSAEVYTAAASVVGMEWKWSESEENLRRALELNPRYARAHHVLAFCLMIRGRYEGSIAEIAEAERLDPLNLVVQTDKANLLLAAGRTDDAFRQWEKTIAIDPNFIMALGHRATAYELLGMESNAIDENANMMRAQGKTPEAIVAFRQTAERHGLKEIRRRELTELLAKLSRGEISPVALAYHYCLIGQKDEAFKYLEQGLREHRGDMVLVVSPEFASLRPDPRFDAILKGIGLSGS